MPFAGFVKSDFEVFDLPDIESRMPALKAAITPKLKELGLVLAPRLEARLGVAIYPHTALHLRRTRNPPEETWTAFAPSARAYKAYPHYRVAVNRDGVRVGVFVEDYADEKALFAAGLRRKASALARMFAEHPNVRACDLADRRGQPLCGKAVTAKALREFGDRLDQVKGQHAAFAATFAVADPALGSGDALLDAAEEVCAALFPLYSLTRGR